ncbi:MAG: sugar phosphate isomerase/epimerase [Clostridia bacterium]|nr:sugar phosphate isomerase/epimerase [Clostridia bacterium]
MLKTVSTLNVPGKRFGETEALRHLKDAGFDGVDFSMFGYDNPETGLFYRDDWQNFVKTLKKAADEVALPFLQAHAPFPSNAPDDDARTAEIRRCLGLSLEACHIAECPMIVFHPTHKSPLPADPAGREEIFQKNVEFYGSYLARAKELGVMILTENMFGRSERYNRIVPSAFSFPEEINRLVDTLDGQIGVCLDVGHSILVNDPMEHMAKVLGHRLKALHLHSNDGISDRHTAPLIHPMNWEELGHALYEIGYQGPITLESDGFLRPLPVEMTDLGLRFMCENARYIASLVK